MSDSTPRLGLPDLPDTPELYADTVSDAFARLDAFTDLYLKGQFVNTPPASPDDGDAYLIGGAPTGAWSGYAYKIAACRDGAWETYAPFNGLRAFVAGTGAFIVYADGVWTDWTSLISAAEVSIASAAICDIGAAGSMCLLITGTTAIASLGTAVCKLRFLRFAGALTLAHDAANLVLPGAANIITAAGDTAIFTSDAGGRWRCRCYQRASGLPVSLLNPAITGTLAAAAANFSGALNSSTLAIGGASIGANALAVTGDIKSSGNMVVGPSNYIAGGGAAGTPLLIYGSVADTSGLKITPTVLNFGPDDTSTNSAAINLLGGNGSGAGAYISFKRNNVQSFLIGDAAAAIGGTGTDAVFWVTGANAVRTYVNGAEANRTGSDGSFLVGTQTNGGWTGLARMVSEIHAPGYAMSGYSTASAGAPFIARIDNTSSQLFSFFYTSSAVGSITTDGTATAYNTTSDARLKTVLPRQGDYRAAIRALWVGDFTWKDSGAPGFGVLAQQAWAVMPHHQGVTRPVDEAGQWQASAEPFAHLALWGVKDLYVLIEALAARVAVLEAAHAAG